MHLTVPLSAIHMNIEYSMDYDEDRIYYSYQNLQTDRSGGDNDGRNDGDEDEDNVNLDTVKRHFREFLRKS